MSRTKQFRLDRLVIPDLESIPVETRKKGMREAVKTVSKIVRETAPDSGQAHTSGRKRDIKLKKSIRWGVRKQGRQGIVRATAPHAHLVHDGTRPHVIRAKSRASAGRAAGLFTRRRAMAMPIGGHLVFRKFVRHPGAKAQPFLTEAAEQGAEAVAQVLRDAANAAIDEVAR
jgi:HK97 gp10 family phage protein